MSLKSLGALGLCMTVFLICLSAVAAPLTFNVDGVIKDSTNQPLEAASVAFRIEVKDPNETCLLYQEDFTVVMTGSAGYFSITVGNQSNAVAGGASLDKVFANNPVSIPGQSCTYTPASTTATRKIIVSFDDGVVTEVFTAQEVQSVPYALESAQTLKIGDYDKNHILRIDPAIATPVNSDLDAAKLAEFFRLVNNPATAYVSSIPTLGGDIAGTLPAMTVEKIKGYTVATPAGAADNGKVLTFNSVTGWTLQSSAAPGDSSYATKGLVQFDTNAATSGMVYSSGGVAKVNVGVGVGQILQFTSAGQLPALDGSLLTNITVGNSSITSAKILDGTIADADVAAAAAISWTKIAAPTNIAGYGITDAIKNNGSTPGISANLAASIPGTGTVGDLFVAHDAGKIYRWNGSAWVVVAASADGTKLPLSGGTMTGALNMGAQNITNTGNISMANNQYLTLSNFSGATGTAAGQIWYDAGVIKYHDGSSAKTLGLSGAGMSSNLNSGSLWVGNASNVATAVTMSGDVTMDNSGAVTIEANRVTTAKINANAITAPKLSTGGVVGTSTGVVMAATTGNLANFTCSTNGHVLTWTVTGWSCAYPTDFGLQNLNGSTQSSQSFAATTAGNSAPTWSTNVGTGVHTLDIPMASATGVTAGLISKTSYDTFNSKLGTALNSGQLWVGNGSNVATAVSVGGDMTMSNAGAISIGTGKVTSTHILDATITSADLSSGGTISATSGLVVANTTGNLSKVLCSTVGEVLSWTAGGWSCAMPSGLGYTPVNKAGDTMSGTLGIPANGFIVGTSQLVAANGYVGFGTTNPNAAIDVQGTFNGPPLSKFSNAGIGAAGAFVNNSTVFANLASSAYAAAFMGANVGVGTTTPSYALDVVGDIRTSTCLRTSAGIASGTCASDERLKTDIQSFNLGLEALQGISPKYYRYNGLGGVPRSANLELGVIAQDVERTAPELVVTQNVTLSPGDNRKTEIKTVNYNGLLYMLINAVKELSQLWSEDSHQVHRELASIKAENEVLKKDSARLREENMAIKSYLCSKDRSASICN